jgi:hypothetical protein
MDAKNIISSVINKYNTFPTKFYKKAIDKLNTVKSPIYDIPNDKYIVESVRLYLDSNINKYHYYIGNHIIDNVIYRSLMLSSKGITNINRQLQAINSGTFEDICNEDTKYDRLYLIISNDLLQEKDYIKLKNSRDSLKLLLGIESLDVAEHQNLNRLCKYIRSNYKETVNSIKTFKKYYTFNNTINQDIKFRTIIFSGSILQSLGTTYTQDIDLLYYGVDQSKSELYKVINTYDKDVDYTIIGNGYVITKEGISKGYKYQWFSFDLPRTIGVENLKEVIVDPQYHYYFMGIKYMSVRLTIERLLLRSAPSSFVDLIMLHKINNYKCRPCFPNISLRQGKITVYTDNLITKKLNTVKKYFKHWHGIHTTIDQLKDKLPRCSDMPNYICKKKVLPNKYTNMILSNYNNILYNSINEYINKNDHILDIGGTVYQHINFFNKYTSNITTITNKQIDKTYDINIINQDPFDNWSKLIRTSYNIIFIDNYIHNINNRYDILINNIKKVQADTIIITCLDGQAILDKLQGNQRYEIYIDNEPLFGIYKFNGKLLLYFKGIQIYEQGYIQDIIIIEDLINKFKSIGYNLIDNIQMTYASNNKLMNILKLYRILIFSNKTIS